MAKKFHTQRADEKREPTLEALTPVLSSYQVSGRTSADLKGDDLEAYARLIRVGDAESVALALAYHRDARADAKLVQDVLPILAELKRLPRGDAADTFADDARAELASLERQMESLRSRQDELRAKLSRHSPPSARRRTLYAHISVPLAGKTAVRLALADDLKAAGVS